MAINVFALNILIKLIISFLLIIRILSMFLPINARVILIFFFSLNILKQFVNIFFFPKNQFLFTELEEKHKKKLERTSFLDYNNENLKQIIC